VPVVVEHERSAGEVAAVAPVSVTQAPSASGAVAPRGSSASAALTPAGAGAGAGARRPAATRRGSVATRPAATSAERGARSPASDGAPVHDRAAVDARTSRPAGRRVRAGAASDRRAAGADGPAIGRQGTVAGAGALPPAADLSPGGADARAARQQPSQWAVAAADQPAAGTIARPCPDPADAQLHTALTQPAASAPADAV
jgi:hypothetical protein